MEFRARWRDHQVAYPRFVASVDAIGCGPIVPGQSLTPRQEAYVREHEAFEASGVLPAWEQKRADLDAERLGLHARALSVDAGSEAGDLLELLDDQEVDGNVEQLGTAAAAAAGPVGGEIRACREDEQWHVTSREAVYHHQALRIAVETTAQAGPPSSTDRPALRPPSPGTTPAERAPGSSSPIAPTTGSVGR